MKLLLLALLLLPLPALAVIRDFQVSWTQTCQTTGGDDLDIDDDGICELLTGFRVYDADTGGFIVGFVEDGTRTQTFTHNDSYGTQCYQMTAVIDFGDGTVDESVLSNVGGCALVRPLGSPIAPSLDQ